MHPVAAAGFARAADVYERARPSYPVEAVAWMAQRCALGAESTVVDVGAGTGKLTRLLPAIGARVVAIEPVAEMRAKLDALGTGVEVVDGTAESIPLPDRSATAITVAQAFHWFVHERALPELHRVLAPGGYLVLFWNNRDLDDPVQRGVEELLAPMRGSVASQLGGVWREPLARSPLFGAPETREFVYVQQFTTDDLSDRVASTSFVAALPEDERVSLLERVRGLTRAIAEPFPFRYQTEVHVVPRSGDRDELERGTSIEG
ncbi:MAG: class I SAM-dependent methyltransferase [Gaiellaceae bacterium]